MAHFHQNKNAGPTTHVVELVKSVNFSDYRALSTLVSAMKYKDPYTYYHVRRVACYSAIVCAEMNLHPQVTKQIILSALAHDVGKIGTPDRILKKPGRLTKDEFLIMKEHPDQTIELLQMFKECADLLPVVRHHHERMDGFGYPSGLKGEEIPFGSRVILVADTYDAIVSDRPYRRGASPNVAFDELRTCSGTQFDRDVVDAFIRGMEKITSEHLNELERIIEAICQP